MWRSRPSWLGRLLFVLVLFLSTLQRSKCTGEEVGISEWLRLDAEALRAVKGQIGVDSAEALSSWNVYSNPCRWNGVECDRVETEGDLKELETRVVGLELWGLELEGTLAKDIGRLTALRRLVVAGNKFSGSIPREIVNCHNLVNVDLRANEFSGPVPFSIANFPHLVSLKLSENQLAGTLDSLFVEQKSFHLCPRLEVLDLAKNRLRGLIPAGIGKCTQLLEVSLNNNDLGGKIPLTFGSLQQLRSLELNGNLLLGSLPSSIANCPQLYFLDVSENMLNGPIPEGFAQFVGEKRFNFASNDFHGRIPQGRWKVHQMALAGAFSNNPHLCGRPLAKLCEIAAKHELGDADSNRRILSLTSSRSRRSMAEGDAPSATPTPAPSDSAAPTTKKSNNTARKWALGLALGIIAGALAAALLATVLRLCVFYLHRPPYLAGPIIFNPKIDPKMLAFLEKEDALPESKLIGAGGAGKVYKVQLETDTGALEVAVKSVIVKEDPKGEFGKKQIQAELETLGCIKHRNLTTLLAYVHRPDCHLLLYQYMKNGSLLDAQRRIASGELVLPWPLRHRIAVGTADGLSYLHFDCDPKIVHRDLKPPNILLDEDYVAHLADFGLAKLIPAYDTHISTIVAGTVGYIAPEYSQTCRFTFKSDVYSYGVVLAVLLTGRDPTDNFFQTIEGGNIGSWLRSLMQEGRGAEAIDPTLRDPAYEEEILLAMKIAVFCTSENPLERPSSKDILAMLRQIRVPEGDSISSDPRSSETAPPAV